MHITGFASSWRAGTGRIFSMGNMCRDAGVRITLTQAGQTMCTKAGI
jgi:hypothetical protein